MKLKQIERPSKRSSAEAKRLPIEVDNEIELIDLSNLTGITSEEDAELSSLNHRIVVNHPVKWEINESGGSRKIYQDGSIELNEKGTGQYHEIYPKCDTQRHDICSPYRAPPYRTIIGACIRPTQINSLLSQNLDGKTTRPPSNFYWWDQTDEGYYEARAKEGLAEHIAATVPNYYCVPETSPHRWRFKCPERQKLLAPGACGWDDVDDDDVGECSNWDYGAGDSELPPPRIHRGDILIYVNPKTGQAEYICPRCSYNNSKRFGGDGRPIKHPITRELRAILSDAGIIPSKEYKNKDRTVEVDALIALVSTNPGISYYRIDQAFEWPKGTAERLIKNHLKGRIKVRKGKKGYRVYLA